MKTTLEFISDLKSKTGLDSDYAIAKHLGITKNALSLYRNGKSFLGDNTAMKVAEMLELDPAYVVACVHAERTKHAAEKKLWERIATLTAGLAATIAIVAILPHYPIHLDGSYALLERLTHGAFDNSGYYASGIYIMRIATGYWWALIPLIIIAFHFFPGKRNDTPAS